MESATLTRPRTGTGRVARLRAVPASGWAVAALVLLCAGALVAFLAYPTFPNYDSYYSLLWAREALHGHALSFDGYRTPTEHPLGILFSLPLALLGGGADRVLVLATLLALVALVAGLYRLGRLTYGPAIGVLCALLLLTRWDFPFLAARGYIDIPYLAIIIWAAALEVARPRRGVPVFLLLAAASLMRPEAWLLMAAYWLWCSWHATWRQRALYTALAVFGPVAWLSLDAVVTGDPLFSLHHTGDTAEALGRAKGVSAVPGATRQFLEQLDKLPVLLAAIPGALLAIWLAPRRSVMPVVLFLVGVGTFAGVGFAGLSVIERYLLVPSLMVMLFAAVAIGGWTMLQRGSRYRRVWAGAAAVLVVGGIVFTALRVSIGSLEYQLRVRGDEHRSLAALLDRPAVRQAERCGAISVPTHKLIPDVRWQTGRWEGQVVARADPSPASHATARRGLAIVVNGRDQLLLQVYTDPTINPRANLPPPGFRRIATNGLYAAYVRC
jgi:hypothetical protein